MAVCNFEICDELGKLDLNQDANEISLYTYWCRVVYTALEHWNIREHAHSFWELHLCLNGSCHMQVNGNEHTLTPNTFLLLGPKTKHTILFESDEYSKFVWGFGIESLNDVVLTLTDYYSATSVLPANEELLRCVSTILSNAKASSFGAFEVIKHELYYLFILLARNATGPMNHVSFKKHHNELLVIRKYIYENISDNLSLDEISSLFYLSKSSIERMCKKEYNQTYSQMKRDLRAEAIRNLLRDTNYPIEQIATMTGFSDRYSLGKFFKKHEGSSPGDYRKGINK